MREIIRILMLENDPLDTKLLIHHLLNRGLNFNFCRVNNSDDFIKELQEFNPQIILSDQSLTDFDCLSALKIALNKNFNIPFIFVCTNENEGLKLIDKGATDYILKENINNLFFVVKMALNRYKEFVGNHINTFKESEKDYRDLFEKSLDPILVCREDGHLVDVNDAGLDFMNTSIHNILNHNLDKWVNNMDISNIFDETVSRKELIFDIDGEEKIFDTCIIPVDSLNNQKLYFISGKDVTNEKMELKYIEEEKNDYKAIFENIGTLSLIFEKDMIISRVNAEFEDFSGFKNDELRHKIKWIDFVAPEDAERMIGYHRMHRIHPQSIPKNFEVSLKNRSGDTRDFFAAYELLNDTGKGILSFRDITEQKKAQNEIKSSLKEKEILLREIHHRVKNNMQIISTLLTLQSTQVNDNRLIELYKESQNRIQAMALIHEKLYQSRDISKINLIEYVGSLITDLFNSYGADKKNIGFELDVDDVLMNIDAAIPCGLIINEIVSNSLKYAFPKGNGKVNVHLHRLNENDFYLKIYDDGIGIPESFNVKKTNTLGLKIVNNLVDQLDGSLKISKPSKFEIMFKELDYKKRV
jgi:two-component system sensor kinase